MNSDKNLSKSPSLLCLLWGWFKELSLFKKIVYLAMFAGLYAASVLLVVAAYWLKTDLNYNVFTHGGWHTFAQCVRVGLELN
ncbi:MAG: hypothetical protein DI585_04620 [Pseudomonas fluorescens]|nr:MAG: hypothetical protein DI585_04620 [Pseudomonas fluorescens]